MERSGVHTSQGNGAASDRGCSPHRPRSLSAAVSETLKCCCQTRLCCSLERSGVEVVRHVVANQDALKHGIREVGGAVAIDRSGWVGGWRGSSRRDAPPPRVRVCLTPRQRTLVRPVAPDQLCHYGLGDVSGRRMCRYSFIQVLAFEVSIGRQPLIRSDRSHRGNGVTHQLELGSASVPASGYRRTRSATGVTSAPRREPQRITSLSFLPRLMFIADYPDYAGRSVGFRRHPGRCAQPARSAPPTPGRSLAP